MTPLPSVLLTEHVNRVELFMPQSVSLCLFPIYRARDVSEHWEFFGAHTLNEQLDDRVEQFAEFGKKRSVLD